VSRPLDTSIRMSESIRTVMRQPAGRLGFPCVGSLPLRWQSYLPREACESQQNPASRTIVAHGFRYSARVRLAEPARRWSFSRAEHARGVRPITGHRDTVAYVSRCIVYIAAPGPSRWWR
jgi:hypothetical protein